MLHVIGYSCHCNSLILLQSDSSVDGSYSFPLLFEKLPEVNQEGSQWTECELNDAINVVYKNLHKLDSYLSLMVKDSAPSVH